LTITQFDLAEANLFVLEADFGPAK
jgi:hypothetical protein